MISKTSVQTHALSTLENDYLSDDVWVSFFLLSTSYVWVSKRRLHEHFKILILQQTNEKEYNRKERLPQNCLLTKRKKKNIELKHKENT